MTNQSATNTQPELIYPDWPAPAGVFAAVSTRIGGVSNSPFDSFNLAYHVEDNSDDVRQNRTKFSAFVAQNSPIQWLQQVHGTHVVVADSVARVQTGDAIFIDSAGLAGAVLTADCLPVFFASDDGNCVAVAHAGWRGLAEGILEQTLARFAVPSNVIAWLGPAIGPCHFEVGAEVRAAFLNSSRGESSTDSLIETRRTRAFPPSPNAGKYYADLYELARLKLEASGVRAVYGGGLCTYCDSSRFYSYRRESKTGRMASLIGICATI